MGVFNPNVFNDAVFNTGSSGTDCILIITEDGIDITTETGIFLVTEDSNCPITGGGLDDHIRIGSPTLWFNGVINIGG